MTDHFCTACGHPVPEGQPFCASCGHPVGAPTPASGAVPGPLSAPSPAPSPAPGPAPDRRLWWAALGIGGAILLVLIALLVTLRDDDGEVTVTSSTRPVATTSTSTSTTTSTTSTTRPPRTTTTVAPTTSPAPPPFDPGPQAPASGFASGYEAVADWAWTTGLNYQGDCGFLDPLADYGADPWCGTFWDLLGTSEIYRVADFPGGDFAYWVLAGSTGSGWTVLEVAEDLTGSPPF